MIKIKKISALIFAAIIVASTAISVSAYRHGYVTSRDDQAFSATGATADGGLYISMDDDYRAMADTSISNANNFRIEATITLEPYNSALFETQYDSTSTENYTLVDAGPVYQSNATRAESTHSASVYMSDNVTITWNESQTWRKGS